MNQQSIIKWISVDDKLPDDEMTVLIADTENDVSLGFHDGDSSWRYCNASKVGAPVTHWAEIPAGPHDQILAQPGETSPNTTNE